MAKKIKLNAKIKPGNVVELINAVGPIPKGIYRVHEVDVLYFHLVVDKAAYFSIPREYRKHLKRHHSVNPKLLTTAVEFIKSYYALLAVEKRKAYDPDKPITICSINPMALRYLQNDFGETKEELH